MSKLKEKKSVGRPRIDVNWEMVKKLCGIQCTQEEIAAVMGFSVDTLIRACEREKNIDFAEYYKKNSHIGAISLRRWQYKLAESGNATMLIWLGKQILGQSDKAEIDWTHNIEDVEFVEV